MNFLTHFSHNKHRVKHLSTFLVLYLFSCASCTDLQCYVATTLYPYTDYATSTNIEKTGSIRAKTKAEFLENLNAKLAKQGMSGRAFAVRNLINSKALVSTVILILSSFFIRVTIPYPHTLSISIYIYLNLISVNCTVLYCIDVSKSTKSCASQCTIS